MSGFSVIAIIAYLLFVAFLLTLCAASKLGADEEAEKDQQYQWLQEHKNKRPSLEPLKEVWPFQRKKSRHKDSE